LSVRILYSASDLRIEIANLDFPQRTILNPFGKTKAARRKLTMTDEVLVDPEGTHSVVEKVRTPSPLLTTREANR